MTEDNIVRELQRLGERMDCFDHKLDEVRTRDLPSLRVHVATEVSALRVKAGVWGLVAGAIPVVITLLLLLLRNRL